MHKTYSIIPCCCLGTSITDKSMKWLWIELYALANFTDTEELHRGQLRTTYTELSLRSGITEKQVRTRIDKLVRQHFLEKTTTNKGLILTIVDYDKRINGKGRSYRNVTFKESEMYKSTKSIKDRRKADETADATHNELDGSANCCQDNGVSEGNQNKEKMVPYNSIRKERDAVVVEETNTTIPLKEFIRNKQLAFQDKVLNTIELMDWKANLEIPEFQAAVVKFLQFYGAWKEDRLLYETIKGFSIEYRLRQWITNEHSLKI